MVIAAGSTVLVQVEGLVSTLEPTSADAVKAAVSADLLVNQGFIVTAFDISAPSFVAGVLSGDFFSYNYTANVSVIVPIDYAQPDDVGAVVAHSFYSAADSYPASVVSTLTTASVVQPLPESPSVTSGFSSAVSGVWSSIQTDLGVGVLVIAAILLVLIAAIFWSPNTKHLAPLAAVAV